MKPGEADQFIALRMAGVSLLKESHMRIAEPSTVEFGDAFAQALMARFGPQNSAGWIVSCSEPADRDAVQQFFFKNGSRVEMARLKTPKENG
jgi:hypothetical protein